MSKRAIFLTKTRWDEPPRLRHQVVNMLQDQGYEIIFFERPSLFCWYKTWKEDGITFIRHFEPVHHRLRVFRWVVALNALIIKFFLRKAIRQFGLSDEPVLNFSYDYYFINDVLPGKVVTIIDDDFVNKLSDGLVKDMTEYQLAETGRNSVMTLAVSYPLEEQMRQFTDKVGLFFPWAEQSYQPPASWDKRDVAVFFGYINYRIYWPWILELADMGVKLRFIGPIQKCADPEAVQRLRHYPNIEFQPTQKITEIDFDDVCCSILPWDESYEGIKAITINNKCFNLLSYGLPQLYAKLPYLMEADKRVISQAEDASEFAESIRFFSENFESCQEPIRDFLAQNYTSQRFDQLMSHFTSDK